MSVGKILVAGDRHVLTRLMVDALREELGEGPDLATLDFEWPLEPHIDVAEVREAAGSEEEVIAAGDSREDMGAAAVVGTFWLVRNAIERDPTLREDIARHDNVRVAEDAFGAGVYEAVVTTLAERR